MANEESNNASNGAGGNQSSSPLDKYTVQPQSNQKDESPFYKSAAPTISLPKGGGALKGIDEKFSVNAVNGTAGLEIALPFTPGRGGFTPSLSLSYNSGSGNSEFGLGWGLGLPGIQRKTDKKLPLYNDAGESDVFLLAGAEDLIPVIDGSDNPKISGAYTIKRYRPRIEGLFARIEYIKKTGVNTGWWRVTTKDNMTTYYGLTADGRIADPENDYRIFKWLPQISIDKKGNVQQFQYIAEDTRNVTVQVNEKNRLNGTAPIANRYLKRVQYCNKIPYFIDDILTIPATNGTPYFVEKNVYEPDIAQPGSILQQVDFLMEGVFDYGDHPESIPMPQPPSSPGWPSRSDAFSDFHAGFEIRTYRRCKRILMFHHFSELNKFELVRALELTYQNGDYVSTAAFTEADLLITATQRGFQNKDTVWYDKALPSMQFHYQPLQWDKEIHAVDKEDFKQSPQGLTGPYQWMDFEGEGISGILTEQVGGWFYKNNLGDGHFDTAKIIAPKPSFTGLGAGALQWQDLDADGRRQVVSETPTKGYWELDDDQEWEPFHTFAKNLNIDWESPFTKMLDLNGDGKADVLLTEDRAWTWYENKGKEGFDIGGNAINYKDEEKGPMLLLRDAVQSIFLADMNGDGMTDLVRIKNGEICYWPNKGYGKFGAKVSMVDAPVFQTPDLYSPLYLSLADISGTGAADLIYVGKNKCTAWINLSGNGWGQAVDINPLPGTNAMSKISVLDFLGNGTGCIVWSSPLPQHSTAPMQYIDLMGGDKAYLMRSYDSGMGKTVSVNYKSSTQFYLADKLAGNPWITRLPFPVHCISSITTTDIVSETSYTQTYKYRHGYYDHEEREFRGFGYVETQDIDSAAISANAALDQNPVLTKTWNHTGAWLREDTLINQYKKEYFQFDDWDTATEIAAFPDPSTMNPQEWREAHRALKGSPLRQEVYALDGALQSIPFSVTANAYIVKKIQPQGNNRYASFQNIQLQSVAFSSERQYVKDISNADQLDIRIAQQLTLATDQYGNVLKSAAIAYPRQYPAAIALPAKVTAEQVKMHISYSENTFTIDPTETASHYRLRVGCEAKSYEVLGFTIPTGLWTVAGLLNLLEPIDPITHLPVPIPEIDFSASAPSGVAVKRLLSNSRVYFKNDDANAALALGILEPLAIPHNQYQLAFTDTLREYCYDADAEGSGTDVLVTPEMILEGGYVDKDADLNYWIPSGTAEYWLTTGTPIIDNPRSHFYIPTKFIDPWNKETRVDFWPAYWLLPKSTTDALGNISTVNSYDWRILQPLQMQDINDNVSDILYDILGMPVAMAIKGKASLNEGDSLVNLNPLDPTDIINQNAFWSTPETVATALLKDATWRCVYDLDTIPVAVGMIAREYHVHVKYPVDTPLDNKLIRLSYSDGMGRVIMHKVQAEPDPATPTVAQWIGSGRTIYNNKGNVVMQYEPYFSITHACDTAEQAELDGAVSPEIHYDPLSRAYKTDMPDGTFTKTEWTVWQQIVFDNNDTVADSEWYALRTSGGSLSGIPEEADAAAKALLHNNTPTVMHTDTLGRPIYTIQEYKQGYFIPGYVNLDVVGNRIAVIDGLDRMQLNYRYNMLKQVCYQHSIDSGNGFTLVDVAGQPLYAWDATGRRFKMLYDALRRVTTKRWDDAGKVLEIMTYGETNHPTGDPKTFNLRGQVYEHFDGSGKQWMPFGYDFKGVPVQTKQSLFQSKTITDADWLANPTLDAEVFTNEATLDAFGRPILVVDPGDNNTVYTYDKGGNLKTVTLNGDPYVNDIRYDAKGQRQSIRYENGTKTNYTYDPQNYRLRKLVTIKLMDGTKMQDLSYFYDPVGNITWTKDAAQQNLFYANTIITPDQKYTYDAIYRLIKAEGREQLHSNSFGAEDNWNDNGYCVALGADAARRYTQNYLYDAVGNIMELQHSAGTGSYTRVYAYGIGSNNRLTSTTIGSDPAYEYTNYDVQGNMQHMPHLSAMNWNANNELYSITKGSTVANYQYSGGQRIRKYVDKVSTKEERIYLGSYEIYRRFDSTGSLTFERKTVHVSDDTGRIAMLETYDASLYSDATDPILKRFIYSNHLQSATLELNQEAEIISYEEYHPYGTTSFQANNDAINASAKRYRYTGKEKDEESGLYYHGARYYIPWLGRWTACDPLESKYGGGSPYVYCSDNPVNRVDQNGMSDDDVKLPKGVRSGGVAGGFEGGNSSSKPKSISDLEPIKMGSFNISGKTDNARDVRSKAIAPTKYEIFGDIHDIDIDMSQHVKSGEIKPIDNHENTWYYLKLISKTVSQASGTTDPVEVVDAIANPFYKQYQQFASDITDNPIVRNLDGTQAWNNLNRSQSEFDKRFLNFVEVSSNFVIPAVGRANSLAISAEKSVIQESSSQFLYRFDKRSPTEIENSGGFKSWGNDMDLFLHMEGTNIGNKTSGYISTSTDLDALKAIIGNRQSGYIYKIEMQSNGINVNEFFGNKSLYPEEMEIAIPQQIDLRHILGYYNYKP